MKGALIVLILLLQSCVSIQHKHEPVNATEISERSNHVLTLPYRNKKDGESYYGGLYHLSCTDKKADGTSYYIDFDKDSEKNSDKPTRADLAKLHYHHAAMASNVYRDPKLKPIFVIPGWTLLEALESDSGLGVELYGDGKSKESSNVIVVAFRGTNFGQKEDWINNLSLTYPTQYTQGYEYVLKKQRELPNKKIIAVGHSLGGAIAIDVAMKVADVDAVVFNPSPRFITSTKYTNDITVIYERGEVLNWLFGRVIKFRLPHRTNIGNYDFLDYRFYSASPIPEHGIYELARALTLVAMTRGVKGAKDMFVANIPESKALCLDKKNCSSLYANN
jgi:pimeloyl-ACP methyl ester carboxylesterase